MPPKNNLPQLFRMLGLAVTVPTVLISGPLAGFLAGQWLIQKWNFPSESSIILVLLGLFASAVQTVRILKRLYSESKEV